MFDIKPFWQSTTIWGGVTMLLPTLLGFIGVDLSETEVAALPMHLDAIIEVVGFVAVILGRLTAKRVIGLSKA
jgi:hypothetical protein